MSRRAQRAMALLMLHHQAMGGGVPPVPPALIAEPVTLPPPQAWYRRAWAWLRDRYDLVGWRED
jgi:hypothetical protein